MAAKLPILYFLLFCQIFGIAIFLKGFFPIKKNSPGFSTRNVNGSIVRNKFDRLIVIMIDALRADFVLGNDSCMSFTNKLIAHGDTFSFQAYSNPPTVTMPRIKAITTGTIPGFIDVILNVDSKELTEDNLITQMKNSNKKIIFFGDDTWIKLFPNHFVRHDGTTSFFVTDYTEVDNNVTRHIVPEMDQSDWDVMILHYLGLDHIGHLAGPNSPLVRPKLTEMDQIIQIIYKSAVRQDKKKTLSTLMVLCGDHGMSDGGSHGGSSSAETTTPLVFMSSVYERGQGKPYEMKRVKQIDIAPTLALLFGLSIPKNSIGTLIPDLLTRHSVKERLDAVHMNTLQIFEVYQTNMGNESIVDLDLATRLHKEWLKDYKNKSGHGMDLDRRAEKISKFYYSGMQVMTQKLTKYMSSYDFYALYIGIWCLVLSLLGSVFVHLDLVPQSNFLHRNISSLSITFLLVAALAGWIHIHLCSSRGLGTSELFCDSSMLSYSLSCIVIFSTAIALLVFASIVASIIASGLPTSIYTSCLENTDTVSFLVFGLILHNISLLSTSFIEEEHQTWYFLTTTYHLILLYKAYLGRRRISHSYLEKEVSRKESLSSKSSARNRVINKNELINATQNRVGHKTNPNILRTSTDMLILLLCNRALRSWNQTGIKWAEQHDVGDWLLNPENKNVLSLLTIVSLVGITFSICYKTDKSQYDFFEFTIFTAGAVGVYLYRASTGCVNFNCLGVGSPETGIQLAQFVYLCVFIFVLKSLFQLWCEEKKVYPKQRSPGEVLVAGYVLLISLLLRTHNIPLVALMLLQVRIHRDILWERCESSVEVILSAYYIGWFTYFAQGNSNSLATVDIGAGYTGLGKNYWPIFVGLQTSLATFSGPLFWLLQAVIFILSKQNFNNRFNSLTDYTQVCTILLMIKSLNLTVCAILSWLNCYHLFVWSVFSPKLLYEGVVSLVIGVFILIVSTIVKI